MAKDFWGREYTKTWWGADLADGARVGHNAPGPAIDLAIMPPQIMAKQAMTEARNIQDEAARLEAEWNELQAEQKAGFKNQKLGVLDQVKSAWGEVDDVMSNVKGWGVFKSAVRMPVDGAVDFIGTMGKTFHFLAEEVVSQPLSASWLQFAKLASTDDPIENVKQFLSPSEWAESYGVAEHQTPGQTLMNAAGTMSAELNLPFDYAQLTPEQRAEMKTNYDKFLYDKSLWRGKDPETYGLASGTVDFARALVVDPTTLLFAGAGGAIKGARALRVAGADQPIPYGEFPAEKLGRLAGEKLTVKPKTPEDITNSKAVKDWFDRMDKPDGTTMDAFEIRNSPEWGGLNSRYRVRSADSMSEVLAQTTRAERETILRFGMGDMAAAQQLADESADILMQLGKMDEMRHMLKSSDLDSALLAQHLREVQAIKDGTAIRSDRFPQMTEPPYPRPTEPGPRQAGWDATYGDLAKQAMHRRAAEQLDEGFSHVRGLDMDDFLAAPNPANVRAAKKWKKQQAEAFDAEIDALRARRDYYATVLGDNLGATTFSPAGSQLFGTVNKVYRTGPLARSGKAQERAHQRRMDRYTLGKGDKVDGGSGFATRILRQGFYGAPIRVMQAFGDSLPPGLVDHNAARATDDVAAMIRAVPDLGQETRLAMIRAYDTAGDKYARAKALDDIHAQIVDHIMVNRHKLDATWARKIDDLRHEGMNKVISEVTGTTPLHTRQVFAAASADGDEAVSRHVHRIEDGEGVITIPIASTQHSAVDMLFPVAEFVKQMDRHAGQFQRIKQAGGQFMDVGTMTLDQINSLWKMTTLARPGYVLRNLSDEVLAGSAHLGGLRTILDTFKGGNNLFQNRARRLSATMGRGDYGSATAAAGDFTKTRIKISDDMAEAMTKAGAELGLEKNVISAYVSPNLDFVNATITRYSDDVAQLEEDLAKSLAVKAKDANRKRQRWNEDTHNQIVQNLAAKKAAVDEFTGYAHELIRRATDAKGKRLYAEGGFEYRGQHVPYMFSDEWTHPIARETITSEHGFNAAYRRATEVDRDEMIRTGNWVIIDPTQSNHMDSWLRAINLQFRQDDLFQQVAMDPTLEGARKWLRTREGQLHMSKMGIWNEEPETFLHAVKQTLDKYVPEGTGLQQKLAAGEEIAEHELRSAIKSKDFPSVHGEEIRALTKDARKFTAMHKYEEGLHKAMKFLGTMPQDIAARHPMVARLHEVRFKYLMDQEAKAAESLGRAVEFTPEVLEKIHQKASAQAIQDLKKIAYDPKRTSATEMTRFMAGFFSSHIDSLQRWTGLIVDRPAILGKVAKIYNAPVAANLVTDQYGNQVDEHGNVTIVDEITGERHVKHVPIQDRVISTRIPGLKGGGKVAIKMQSINTIMPGDPWFNPGAGPLVQVAGSTLLKFKPEWGEFLEWAKVLPYGPESGTLGPLGHLVPNQWDKTAELLWAQLFEDGEAYQEHYLAALNLQRAMAVETGEKIDLKKAAKDAKQFMFLEAMVAFNSPAQFKKNSLTGTRYQLMIDAYRSYMDMGMSAPEARLRFSSRFGSDFLFLTEGMNKSMGIAATLTADAAAKAYEHLIGDDEEMAWFAAGDDDPGMGPFSRAVFLNQFNERMGGKAIREKMTAEQAFKVSRIREGWRQATNAFDVLDAGLLRSGYTSYAQKGAAGHKEARDMVIEQLSAEYPEWYEEYTEQGKRNYTVLTNKLKKFIDDERFSEDPLRSEIPHLKDYLAFRSIQQKRLRERGNKTVSMDVSGEPIGDNADLIIELRTAGMQLAAADTRFARVYNRLLSKDNLS